MYPKCDPLYMYFHIIMQAQVFVIPAAPVVRVNVNPERSSSVAWWVIVAPILAAVIAVTAVGVLLQLVSQCKNTVHYNSVSQTKITKYYTIYAHIMKLLINIT